MSRSCHGVPHLTENEAPPLVNPQIKPQTFHDKMAETDDAMDIELTLEKMSTHSILETDESSLSNEANEDAAAEPSAERHPTEMKEGEREGEGRLETPRSMERTPSRASIFSRHSAILSRKNSAALQKITTAVDWAGPDDPDNPLNWSTAKKAYHTAIPALQCFTMYACPVFAQSERTKPGSGSR